ncbi:MFS transporter [Actinoplanes sp. NPDC004185]
MRRSYRWLILIVLCLSTLALVIDNMALAVALPSLAEDLGASPQDMQWILDSYILVFAGLLLTAGSLSDRYGRRRVMVIGLTLFGAASLAAAVAADPIQLIAARTVMGVGGALVMPSTLSILITVFDAVERRRAMACWSAVAMLGLVGGPVLGGALIAHFHWGAVFLINVPVVALAIVAAFALMPESKGPANRLDPVGAVLSVVGMTALLWTVIDLTHGVSWLALTTAVLALAGFVAWELHTPHPMVPLRLFRNRVFSGGSLSLTLVQIGNGGLLLILTQYLQYILGFTPTQAGLAFIPMAVASLAFNTLGATVAAGIGHRTLIACGLTTMAAGFGVLAALSPGAGFVQPAVGLFLLGAGGGLAVPAAVSALMSTIPVEHAGVGSALNDTLQQAGAALGVALLGSIVSGAFTGTMSDSAPAQAARSIGDALTVAERTGDGALAEASRHAFTTAMSSAFMISAAGVLAAAAIALIVLRERASAPRPAPRRDAAPELTTAARPF